MIKAVIRTEEFSNTLSSVFGCGKEGSIDPLAGVIEIKVKSNALSLRTTDNRDTFIVKMTKTNEDGSIELSKVDCEDFTVAIDKGRFKELIDRTNLDEITLTITDRAVELKGHGIYKFERPIEGDEPIKFEPIAAIKDPELNVPLDVKELQSIIQAGNKFVAGQYVNPVSNSFYFGTNVVTTDGTVACFYQKELLPEPLLLHASTVELLSKVKENNLTLVRKGRQIQFLGNYTMINSVVHQNLDEYDAESLFSYLDTKFVSGVTIDVKSSKELLSRVNIFVDNTTAKGSAQFSFEESGITIAEIRGKAEEVLPYTDAVNFKPFICYANLKDLINVIEFKDAGTVTLWYGDENAIRVDSGDIVRVMALTGGEEMEGDMAEIFENEKKDVLAGTRGDEDIDGIDAITGTIDDVVW